MLAVVHGHAFALRRDVSLQRAHFGIIRRKRFAFDRVFDAPIDHVAQQRDALKLFLVFRISLGMSISGVWMTHVAAYPDSSTKQLHRMKNLVALSYKGVSLRLPDSQVAIME